LKVGKLDAEGHPTARDGQKIQGLPTLILFKDGMEVARHEGAMAKPQLAAFLDANL
jgi:thioredoxin 1